MRHIDIGSKRGVDLSSQPGFDNFPWGVLLWRQYLELSQYKRVIKISVLPGQAIVLVKGKDGTKRKLDPLHASSG
jgi:hypothetical protein